MIGTLSFMDGERIVVEVAHQFEMIYMNQDVIEISSGKYEW